MLVMISSWAVVLRGPDFVEAFDAWKEAPELADQSGRIETQVMKL